MKNSNPNRILSVITAHPDDHICCAGTILHYKKQGYTIHEVVATQGEAGAVCDHNGDVVKNLSGAETKNLRQVELENASQLLGITKTHCLGLKDGEITRTTKTIYALIELIRNLQPGLVLTHSNHDYHPDHVMLSGLVQEAVAKAAWPMQPQLGDSFRVPQSYMFTGLLIQDTDTLVNVTEFKDTIEKLEYLYESQLYPAERALLHSIRCYYGFHLRLSRKEALLAEGLKTFPKSSQLLQSTQSN